MILSPILHPAFRLPFALGELLGSAWISWVWVATLEGQWWMMRALALCVGQAVFFLGSLEAGFHPSNGIFFGFDRRCRREDYRNAVHSTQGRREEQSIQR